MKKFLLGLTFISFFCFQAQSQACDVGGIFIDAFLADPNGANNFDTDGDGTASNTDEFVQICNGGASTVDLSTYTLTDPGTGTFALSGMIPPGQCFVIIADYMGTPPANFIDLNVGNFINNGGDDITISSGASSCTITFDAPAGAGEWGEQDGCASIGDGTLGAADCTVVPADLGGTPFTPITQPVEFVSFIGDIRSGAIELEWITATESNSSHYEIEHSTDGVNWKKLGSTAAAGDVQTQQNYTFIDPNPSKGPNFYRLKQFDLDGVFEYSPVIRLVYGDKLGFVDIRPIGGIEFELFSPESGKLSYEIYSMNGALVAQGEDLVSSGQIIVDAGGQSLESGIYAIRVRINNETITEKFFKQ